jgi:hypothetical protein
MKNDGYTYYIHGTSAVTDSDMNNYFTNGLPSRYSSGIDTY